MERNGWKSQAAFSPCSEFTFGTLRFIYLPTPRTLPAYGSRCGSSTCLPTRAVLIAHMRSARPEAQQSAPPVPAAGRSVAARTRSSNGAALGAPGAGGRQGALCPRVPGARGQRGLWVVPPCGSVLLRLEAAACCLHAARALCWEQDPKPPRAWGYVGIGFDFGDFPTEL